MGVLHLPPVMPSDLTVMGPTPVPMNEARGVSTATTTGTGGIHTAEGLVQGGEAGAGASTNPAPHVNTSTTPAPASASEPEPASESTSSANRFDCSPLIGPEHYVSLMARSTVYTPKQNRNINSPRSVPALSPERRLVDVWSSGGGRKNSASSSRAARTQRHQQRRRSQVMVTA